MFMTRSDEKSANEELYKMIDDVYKVHFTVRQKYNCKVQYENIVNYGFINYKYQEWKKDKNT